MTSPASAPSAPPGGRRSLEPFLVAVIGLVRSLRECDELPGAVFDACDDVAFELAVLDGRDVGPVPR